MISKLLKRGVWTDKDGYLCVKPWRARLAMQFRLFAARIDPGSIGGL